MFHGFEFWFFASVVPGRSRPFNYTTREKSTNRIREVLFLENLQLGRYPLSHWDTCTYQLIVFSNEGFLQPFVLLLRYDAVAVGFFEILELLPCGGLVVYAGRTDAT